MRTHAIPRLSMPLKSITTEYEGPGGDSWLVLSKDESGQVDGVLSATRVFDHLSINALYVRETKRGRGLARAMLLALGEAAPTGTGAGRSIYVTVPRVFSGAEAPLASLGFACLNRDADSSFWQR
eukprot:c14237_g1_i1.p1 GENE.c14237_g1_i1~~c14237_g1_i1.p1  ORF type:complete len:125 (+),score=12.27 c14237_g1_i1:370-744(+)